MNGATFDTHQLIAELRNTGFKEDQAEAVVNASKRPHEDFDAATKSDIKDLRHEMRELPLSSRRPHGRLAGSLRVN